MIDLSNLDESLQKVLRETASYAREEFSRFSYDDVQYKGTNDPFTHVDVTAENMVKKGCLDILPESGFITEEADNEGDDREYIWIIDPIDGTSNFTHGFHYFSHSVALSYKGEIIMGHVYAPMYDEMFVAIRNQGATLNGNPISVSKRAKLPQGLLATGFPYFGPGWQDHYLKMVSEIQGKAHGIRRLGSAALDLANVAAGRLDGFFEFNLSPWDVAAGALLIQEAGGIVTDFDGGNNYIYGRSILGTNGHIQSNVLEIISSYLPTLKKNNPNFRD